MNTRDEKFSVLLMDLGMGVLPEPDPRGFSAADLMQFIPKYRGFYNDPGASLENFSYPVTLRRRRR